MPLNASECAGDYVGLYRVRDDVAVSYMISYST